MQPGREIEVFLVENSAPLVRSLTSLISDIPGARVVGHAAEAAEAHHQIRTLAPDVVVLDLRLQRGTGWELLERFQLTEGPRPVVIVFSGEATREHRQRARRLGADYFYDKSMEIDQLSETIRTLCRREQR